MELISSHSSTIPDLVAWIFKRSGLLAEVSIITQQHHFNLYGLHE